MNKYKNKINYLLSNVIYHKTTTKYDVFVRLSEQINFLFVVIFNC